MESDRVEYLSAKIAEYDQQVKKYGIYFGISIGCLLLTLAVIPIFLGIFGFFNILAPWCYISCIPILGIFKFSESRLKKAKSNLKEYQIRGEEANFAAASGKSQSPSQLLTLKQPVSYNETIVAHCIVCNLPIYDSEETLKCPHCGLPSHKPHLLEWVKIKNSCPNCDYKLTNLTVTHSVPSPKVEEFLRNATANTEIRQLTLFQIVTQLKFPQHAVVSAIEKLILTGKISATLDLPAGVILFPNKRE